MMGLQLIFFLIGFALLHMGHIRNGGVHFCFAVRLDGGVGDIFAVAGSDLAGGQGVLLAIIPVTAQVRGAPARPSYSGCFPFGESGGYSA